MSDNTSLIVVVLVLVMLYYLFSDCAKKTDRKTNRAHKPGCKTGTSFMASVKNLSELENFTDNNENSYENYMMDSGLEKSVSDSHKQYVDDMQNRTSGASSQTETSHDENINPWVGLRRPDYSNVPVDSGAREVPSQTPEQLYESSCKKRCGLF